MYFKILLLGIMLLAPIAGFSQSSDSVQITFPLIEFEANSRSFTPATLSILPQVANDIKHDPSLRIVVGGYGGGTKYEQQLSWAHVDAFIQYMSEHEQIDRNRFIFRIDGNAPINAANLRFAAPNEPGPSYVAPPSPDITIR